MRNEKKRIDMKKMQKALKALLCATVVILYLQFSLDIIANSKGISTSRVNFHFPQTSLRIRRIRSFPFFHIYNLLSVVLLCIFLHRREVHLASVALEDFGLA